jgi:ketosteroid isomerase-like protein
MIDVALPTAASAWLDALAAGDLDAAVALTAPEALCALPPASGTETASRVVTHGRGALRAVLEPTFGGRRLETLACVADGDDVLLEGRTVTADGAADATILAALRGGEQLGRALVWAVPLAEPSPTWADAPPSSGDARAIVDRYFELLDAADFEGAADCFSKDVLYSHPPYGPGQPRAEFRGRDELVAGFRRRGPKPDREHTILRSPQSGRECLLEGFTVDKPVGASFISSLSLDDDGRIRRYVAVLCEPVVS